MPVYEEIKNGRLQIDSVTKESATTKDGIKKEELIIANDGKSKKYLRIIWTGSKPNP